MVALLTSVVTLLGCAATTTTAAAAGRPRRDSTTQDSSICNVEEGNQYCAPVNHVRYKVAVNSAGSYRDVTNMNTITGQCDFQQKNYSGPLAPFNEPMSVHFRGPIHLKQFAVYVPMHEDTHPPQKRSKTGSGDSPTDKVAEKLAKKDDVDWPQLDLAKLEQRTQHIVWVTETKTFWATVTPQANRQAKANGDGAFCGVPAPFPVPIKSQAPLVPVPPTSVPFSLNTTTASLVVVEVSETTTTTSLVVPVSEATTTTSLVVVPAEETSFKSSLEVVPVSETTFSSSRAVIPITETSLSSDSAVISVSTLVSVTSSSIAAPTSSSLAGNSIVVSTVQSSASISSTVDVPIVQPTPSSQDPESESIASSTTIIQSAAVPSPTNNAGIQPEDGPHHDFHRIGFYHAKSQQSSGIVFLGNKGDGVHGGEYDPKFGASLSYIFPNATTTANDSFILADMIIPSTEEFSIFSSAPCSDANATCGYTRPGARIPQFQGFGGSYRIFLFEFSMPHDTFAKAPNQAQYDTPAIWLLNSKIPRTQQYGDCSCWEGGQGCGEFDVFEMLSAGEMKAVTSIKGAGDSGNQGLSDWFQRPVDEDEGIKLAVGLDEEGGVMWISSLGKGDEKMFGSELTKEEVAKMMG
ncbi:putative TOS1-like glycosyl hydrolase-domain-containing protein [Podospora fimiseda]|uniref:glucan endo-1,3-beta-D-glucosidase n=1 Tax=Podospora fimiseda TaxID=252190 RepID=A0AAN7BT55_9PEZI|nr:putative TOS1-like glycosyl hydrolase-domain-containing protein [Podospora fimiseda]